MEPEDRRRHTVAGLGATTLRVQLGVGCWLCRTGLKRLEAPHDEPADRVVSASLARALRARVPGVMRHARQTRGIASISFVAHSPLASIPRSCPRHRPDWGVGVRIAGALGVLAACSGRGQPRIPRAPLNLDLGYKESLSAVLIAVAAALVT